MNGVSSQFRRSVADILFKCGSCAKQLVVDAAGAGIQINCPSCDISLTVPQVFIAHICPHCSQAVKIDTALKGEVLHCPSCNKSIVLPVRVADEILFLCKRCQETIKVSISEAGKLLSCPKCEGWVSAPELKDVADGLTLEPKEDGLMTNCPSCGKRLPQGVIHCIACNHKQQVVSASPAPPTPSRTIIFPCGRCDFPIIDTESNLHKLVQCPRCRESVPVTLTPVTKRGDAPPSKSEPVVVNQPLQPTPTPPTKKCPSCQQSSDADAIICVGCGYNFKTGKKIDSVVDVKPSVVKQTKPSSNESRNEHPIAAGGRSPATGGNKKILIGVGVVGAVVVLFLAVHKSENTGQQSSSGTAEQVFDGTVDLAKKAQAVQGAPASNTKPSMPDDQYYGYLKTKFDDSSDPADKLQLMQSYLGAYPKGKHMGEATALLEKAQVGVEELKQAQTKATIVLDGQVTLGSGQTIPIQGYVQVVEYCDAAARLKENLANDEAVQRGKRIAELDAQGGSKPNMTFYFWAVGDVLRKSLTECRVVASGQLSSGKVAFTFENMNSAKTYIVYGCGQAGMNWIGFNQAVIAKPGQALRYELNTGISMLVQDRLVMETLFNHWKIN